MRKHLGEVLAIVRGAGEIGTAVGCALYRSCIRVLIVEADEPTGLAAPHTFVGAMAGGRAEVEGVVVVRAQAAYEFPNLWGERRLPIFPDPQFELRGRLRPDIVIDARDPAAPADGQLQHATLLVAAGRKADVGREVHAAVGTAKQAGQVFWQNVSWPEAHPGRVFAPVDGVFTPAVAPGDRVTATAVVGTVGDAPVTARTIGRVRALAAAGKLLRKGQPVAQLGLLSDAETPVERVTTSARATAGGVIEAILATFLQVG